MSAAKKADGEGRQKSHNFCGIDQLPLPSCAIIITHYNLASYLRDALESVISQTYQNWQCLVVDDASDDEQFEIVQNIVDEFSHPKVRLIRNQQNLGQTLAGFEGLRQTESQFVSFLDPDDRLLPEFLEEMITMHLNPVIVAPYVSANQFLKEENKGVIASVARSSYLVKRSGTDVEAIWKSPSSGHQLYFIEPSNPGWNRTANSSMVYRRAALQYCIPKKPLSIKNNADSFMSWGCHFLGGTLFYDKPLVIRQITGVNEFISQEVYSSLQIARSYLEKPNKLKEDSIIALLDNDADLHYKEKYFKNLFMRYKNLDFDYINNRTDKRNTYVNKILKKKNNNNFIYKLYYKFFDR